MQLIYAGQYSIICDGAQDISGKEQESISIRFVDADLFPQEVFIGFIIFGIINIVKLRKIIIYNYSHI